MTSYKYLYESLTSLENLELAFQKARKRKTLRDYVNNFENKLKIRKKITNFIEDKFSNEISSKEVNRSRVS